MAWFSVQVPENIEVEKYVGDQILITQTEENGHENEICFHASTLDELIKAMKQVAAEIKQHPDTGEIPPMPPELGS